MVNSYLLKDILTVENVKNSDKMLSLLKLLAYQVGGEVSYHELGRQLGLSKNTVERYLNLLSKVFIIPGAWRKNYMDSEFKIINGRNYHEWIM